MKKKIHIEYFWKFGKKKNTNFARIIKKKSVLELGQKNTLLLLTFLVYKQLRLTDHITHREPTVKTTLTRR